MQSAAFSSFFPVHKELAVLENNEMKVFKSLTTLLNLKESLLVTDCLLTTR